MKVCVEAVWRPTAPTNKYKHTNPLLFTWSGGWGGAVLWWQLLELLLAGGVLGGTRPAAQSQPTVWSQHEGQPSKSAGWAVTATRCDRL